MENILGRQLWSAYEDLKREKKIGFLTEEEFQKYFLGFISYKYLSEKLESYVGNLMKIKGMGFEEAYYDSRYADYIKEESIKGI